MFMKELCEVRAEKIEYLFYPPILDEDPTFAANFLTIKDSEICYEVMSKVFEEFSKEGATKFSLIQETMCQSKSGFFWFLEFFKELERVLAKEPISIDLKNIPSESSENIEFYPPTNYKKPLFIRKEGLYRPVLKKIRIRVGNPINKYRALYISNAYEVTAFREGFPAWYSLRETTVFEKYDEKTNHRVRIDFRDGEFFYFLSGASDNWQQITEVPIEIDYVVMALLFRD